MEKTCRPGGEEEGKGRMKVYREKRKERRREGGEKGEEAKYTYLGLGFN